MTKIFKLTAQQNTTYNGFLWTPGKWVETSGEGDLCGPGWLHAYSDPLVAVFMNLIHANIEKPKLWEGEANGEFKDDKGLKCGYTRMRIIKEINLPVISTEQRIKVAIHCAILSGYDDESFIAWALHWMDGSDRSPDAAWTACAADAVWTAWTACAADAAARAAAWAADAACAAWAAAWAADAAEGFDLAKILHEICD